MKYAYSLYGGTTPLRKQFQAGEAMANAGVPVLVGGAGEEGLTLPTTTGAADCVGVTIDTAATITTAQQSDNSDPASYINVIVDPGAVFAAKISGGATEDTALTLYDVTTASAAGTAVTTGDDWSSPDFDEGILWGYDGANVGVVRKITSTSTTAATVTTALPFDTAVGDRFLRAPFAGSPVSAEDQFVQLSTNFYQVDGSVTIDTDNNNFRVLEVLTRDQNDDGQNNSFVLLTVFDHLYAAGGSV